MVDEVLGWWSERFLVTVGMWMDVCVVKKKGEREGRKEKLAVK